jgi:hypothetical protein
MISTVGILTNMGRSISQIQQELEAIEEKVIELGEELQTLYDRYIDCLSDSVQKQLILAGYQLCTQIYPEAFVEMSLTQRQKLQQSLRQLGKEIQPLLAQKPTAEEISQEQIDLNLIAQMLKNLPLGRSEDNSKESEIAPSETSEARFSPDDDLESFETNMIEEEELVEGEIQEIDLEKLQNLANRELNISQISEIDLKNPQHLLLWQKRIETKIRQTLEDTSRQANKCLQEFDIIPRHLPSKVIDVALKAPKSNSGGKLRNIPNILNLVVETDKGKNKKSQVNATQISLLRLRLSEIEFTDAIVSSKRNEIRSLLKKVQRLESLYQQKKHEHTKAEADAAWRSSWYED